jgi:hypothetical protein
MLLFRFLGIGSRTFGTLALAFFFVAPAQGKDTKTKTKTKAGKEKPVESAENIFTNSQVFHIQIEIPEEGMAALRNYRWGGWGGAQQERAAVKCTVREGDQVYTDVAVHWKGAAGSFRPVDADPALTLNFDKHVKGRLPRPAAPLNNSVQDRSFQRTNLPGNVRGWRRPVPRATMLRSVERSRLGAYVLIEVQQAISRAPFQKPEWELVRWWLFEGRDGSTGKIVREESGRPV